MSILPPNQHHAAPGKWPTVGEKAPRHSDEPWVVRVEGEVDYERTWTLGDLHAMPQVQREIDIHCVTRWSKLGARFGGVPFSHLLAEAHPLPHAKFVCFAARSERNHSTSLPLTDVFDLDPLVALTYEGEPLASEHGGPVRVITPGRYFYKSVKWLERVEFLAEDRLGYWEGEAGYHNVGDPWREERYVVRDLDHRLLAELLARKDFAGRDLLGLQAAGMSLAGLNARGAFLRNADFRKADLRGACFADANLSNAHLQGADLREADFRGADVEGADFRGADLRGSDFTGASLFGCTFVREDGQEAAQIDSGTRVSRSSLDAVTPTQQQFLRESAH